MRVQSLASLSGLRTLRCCELWCRLAARAPIGPLAWERPYAMGAALKRQKDTHTHTHTHRARFKLPPSKCIQEQESQIFIYND